MEEKRVQKSNRSEKVHNLILENRRKLSVSGVDDVESFNEEEIILRTEEHGILVVKGTELHINKLSTDTGDVSIAGEITDMNYIDRSPKSKGPGIISRLLR